jgi:1,4-alpha-glucan branching enzyme
MSHVAIANYKFGVNATGAYKVVLDSDLKAYGGTGELKKRLPMDVVMAEGAAMHGKTTSLSLPYLAPYATVVLEGHQP